MCKLTVRASGCRPALLINIILYLTCVLFQRSSDNRVVCVQSVVSSYSVPFENLSETYSVMDVKTPDFRIFNVIKTSYQPYVYRWTRQFDALAAAEEAEKPGENSGINV